MGRCFILIEILTFGLVFLAVTARSLDMWSARSPNSVRAEQENIYYLNFRTVQLIIRSRYPMEAGYHRYGDNKWIPFGPIFHLYLLNQALDLQNNITGMKVPFDGSFITLKDICYQPELVPEVKQCKIQSIFQYFQNKTKLNKCRTSMGLFCNNETLEFDFKAYDFHDHLLLCTMYPGTQEDKKLEESCLATFGGPVDPNFVLDGFNGTEYKNATTLIINFVLIDYQEKSKLAEVMAWESAFEEYMKDYVQKSSSRNLTITYNIPGAFEGRRPFDVTIP